MRINRLAIANRGEVAVRIIHACHELGIESVLLHSEADKNSRAYRMSNKKICIGPSEIEKSYLNKESILTAVLNSGAQALHPGFGFLSENSDFAQACFDFGIIFVGPSSQSMQLLGDKVQCKKMALELGIPLIPGYDGQDQDLSLLIEEAVKIGFPVMVKAAAGGGGRGMKIIRSKDEAGELISSAKREALLAFGSDKVFLEKYLENAKHIEFQIFGLHTGEVVHYFERECSVQRRHQKIIEEAPSFLLDPQIRQGMAAVAVRLAQAARYEGAGTVEFLLEKGKFYLLEVNTRLQVEHPVTEMVMSVDLVKAQILAASGEGLDVLPSKAPHGHSIECRIYAENPYLGGLPSTGQLGEVIWPEGPWRRFEYGFEKGDQITAFYDSMIAKVIVWDESRSRAIEKMKKVLEESIVLGVYTNIPYLLEILNHPEFISGTMTTRFIEKYFSSPILSHIPTPSDEQLVKQLIKQLDPDLGVKDFSNSKFSNSKYCVSSIPSPFQKYWRNI